MSKRVLLAVGGGIAAYKTATLCSRLIQAGHDVRPMMSKSATEFVGAATLAALSGNAVATEMFEHGRYPLGTHIEVPKNVDLMIVAPATANLLAKFALGLADCVVSTSFLQCSAPVLLAPAMSDVMWQKPSVQRNVELLKKDGHRFVGPESGWLSCREKGDGRMSEPEAILAVVEEILSESDRR